MAPLGFFIVADERCVLILAQQAERDHPVPEDEAEAFAEIESAPNTEAAKAERKTPEDRKNATVIAIRGVLLFSLHNPANSRSIFWMTTQ